MKTKYSESKAPRTSGKYSQNEYDNLLSDLDISSLKFLKFKYNKDIKEFSMANDLNDEDNQTKYKQMLQRKHMIDEELEHREMFKTHETGDYFDAQTGLVYDKDGNAQYSISFNEEETGYVYHNLDGSIRESPSKEEYDEDDDEDDISITPIIEGKKVIGYKLKESERSLKEVYEGWEYYSQETE